MSVGGKANMSMKITLARLLIAVFYVRIYVCSIILSFTVTCSIILSVLSATVIYATAVIYCVVSVQISFLKLHYIVNYYNIYAQLYVYT